MERRLPTYQQLDHLALSQKWVKGDTFRRYKMGINMLPSGSQRLLAGKTRKYYTWRFECESHLYINGDFPLSCLHAGG